MTDPTTVSFEAPGASITYDVRGDLSSGVPLLFVGCPMDAPGFAAVADEFTDRPTITYDPRGTGRSIRQNVDARLSPEDHLEDLHLLVAELGGGPADVFASSGGAMNALAWVSQYPDDVRTLVAHEPPCATALPDRESVLAVVDDIADTYNVRGRGPAMAKFIAFTSLQGPVADGFALPDLDPAQFGLPTEDDGTRDDPLLEQNLVGLTQFTHDLDALRSIDVRVVFARGADSGETIAARAAVALAEQTDRELVDLPGAHVGFTPSEWNMGGDPAAFAVALREVLDA